MVALTGSASTATYYGSAASAFNVPTTPMNAAPAKSYYVNFYLCGTGPENTAPTTTAQLTTPPGVITGNQIGYWDYANGLAFDTAGQASGVIKAKTIGCVITTS